MYIRNRFLVAFISVSLFGLIFVGTVIYNSSVNLHARSDQHILDALSKHALAIAESSSSLLNESGTITPRLADLSINNLEIILKDKTGQLYPAHDNIYSLQFINELTEGNKNSGQIYKEDDKYSWLEIEIPNSQYKLILIKKHSNTTPLKEFNNIFGAPFFATGIVMLWISAWGGLITASLFKKTEEQKKALHAQAVELEQAKDRAISANKAKSIFLSNMSHELRTPLNAVLGFAQLLHMNIEDTPIEQQHENITEIENAGKHLLSLINDVLDLAKIESGHIDVTIEAVQLDKLLNECEILVSPLVEKHKLTLTSCHNLDSRLKVKADYVRLKQVLLNLLSNACKYNKPDGNITINCNITDTGFVHIDIKDTGKGLSLEHQNGLFIPFNRIGAEQTEIEGTGIGLVITKQLIEIMGGNIGVKSKPGKGSTFWIEIEQEDTQALAS